MSEDSRQEITSAPNAPDVAPAAPDAAGGGLTRRTLIGSGLAVAGSSLVVAAPAVATPSVGSDARSGGRHRGARRLQTRSAHSLFTLPEDHQWHGGGIYETGLLEEWHYWTGFFTDIDTGEQFGLFYNLFYEGTGPGTFDVRALFSLDSLDNNSFVWTSQAGLPLLTATAPPRSTSPSDFLYAGHSANTRFRTIYRAKPDTWSLRFHSVAATGPQTIDMALELHTRTPYGYLPMTPYGVENENQPWTGAADPKTMSSLSYYYGGPKTDTVGTVKIGNQVHRLKGSLWLEHQWGNFLFSKTPWATDYIWSALQFNDGSIFTFRQWYSQNQEPLLNLGRHVYATPNNPTTYGFGEAVEFTPLMTWPSPVSHRNFPLYARLTTPFGTWYYSPVFPNYEMPFGYPPYGTSGTSLWEAPCYLHTGSITGPVVGKAFLELANSLTKTFPPLP